MKSIECARSTHVDCKSFKLERIVILRCGYDSVKLRTQFRMSSVAMIFQRCFLLVVMIAFCVNIFVGCI